MIARAAIADYIADDRALLAAAADDRNRRVTETIRAARGMAPLIERDPSLCHYRGGWPASRGYRADKYAPMTCDQPRRSSANHCPEHEHEFIAAARARKALR